MKIYSVKKSIDGITAKLLQETEDKLLTETVYVDYKNKNIICYSCQLGCQIGCRMCYNGVHKQFYRNLTADEIIREINNAISLIDKGNTKPILLSCMGIGEPLNNLDNVVNAIQHFESTLPFCKFAVATTVPQKEKLQEFFEKTKNVKHLKIMFSLHGSNEAIRRKIIPIKINLRDVLQEIDLLSEKYNREVEVNYLLFKDINDSIDQAEELSRILPRSFTIKLNEFNPVEGTDLTASKNTANFASYLTRKGLNVELYSTDGKDIGAACGQLVTQRLT